MLCLSHRSGRRICRTRTCRPSRTASCAAPSRASCAGQRKRRKRKGKKQAIKQENIAVRKLMRRRVEEGKQGDNERAWGGRTENRTGLQASGFGLFLCGGFNLSKADVKIAFLGSLFLPFLNVLSFSVLRHLFFFFSCIFCSI